MTFAHDEHDAVRKPRDLGRPDVGRAKERERMRGLGYADEDGFDGVDEAKSSTAELPFVAAIVSVELSRGTR
jgi:hypothetical protein